jgi:hypothetical protein
MIFIKNLFKIQCRGKVEQILFQARQNLQPYVGNTAKILTPPEIKFANWSPAIEF